jgi:hypothetical protein
MSKEDILNILKEKNIISPNNKKRFCWKEYWDDEIDQIFNEFKQSYRTDKEAWFCLLNNIEPYHCEVCGNLAKFTGTKKTKYHGYNTTCEHCSPNKANNKLEKFHDSIKNRTSEERHEITQKRKKTNLEKYGDENYNLFGSQSFKDNLMKKYGYEYNTQIPEVKEKIQKTNLERYGVKCNLQLISGSEHSKLIWKNNKEKINNKRKKKSLEKYGYDSPNKSPIIKQKQKESLIKHYGSLENAYKYKYELNKKTKLKKYGDENYHNKEQAKQTLINKHKNFEKKNNCTKYLSLLKKYGQGWQSLNLPIIYNGRFRYISNEYIPIIEKYSNEIHNVNSQSNKENELYDYIKSLTNEQIIRNSKSIIKDDTQKYELDIYIPNLHLAFEFNGNYWHTENIKGKYFHQIKTKLCYANNIQLIHIYEFEWDKNKDIIKNRIKELFNGNDCSKYNWININDYNKYKLTEPKIIYEFKRKNEVSYIYNEGIFIKI